MHFDPSLRRESVDEQAFEQVVSRFERFLKNTKTDESNHGLLIHDNNQTVAKRADRVNNVAVGARHFTDKSCECMICTSHRVDAPSP